MPWFRLWSFFRSRDSSSCLFHPNGFVFSSYTVPHTVPHVHTCSRRILRLLLLIPGVTPLHEIDFSNRIVFAVLFGSMKGRYITVGVVAVVAVSPVVASVSADLTDLGLTCGGRCVDIGRRLDIAHCCGYQLEIDCYVAFLRWWCAQKLHHMFF